MESPAIPGRFSFEGEGANQGDVSRPERSGGRVTTTEKEDDRPQPPVSDEGGDRRQAGHHGAEGGASASLCGRGADCANARDLARPSEARSHRERARV